MKKTFIILSVLFLCTSVSAYTGEELEKALYANNTAIRKAAEDEKQAYLDLKDAKAGRGPTISLNITGSYIANPIDPININPADFIDYSSYGMGNSEYVNIYRGMENTYYSFGLQLTQPVFTWGKLTTAVDIYSEVYEVRKLQSKDTADKAATELSSRLSATAYLVQIKDLLLQQQQSAERLTELADSAVENGMMLYADALGIHVQAKQTEVALSAVEQQLCLMETQIASLTGLKDFTCRDFEDEQKYEDETQALLSILDSLGREQVLSLSLSRERNSFKMLESMKKIARLSKEVSGASVNWKPDIALVVNASYGGSRFPVFETDWNGQDDWNAVVTVAFSSKIWDGGKAVRDVSRKVSELEQSEIDYDDAVNQVTSAVNQSLTDIDLCRAEIEYNTALSAQLQEKAKVQKNLWDSGYGSEADYLALVMESRNCEIEILQQKIKLASGARTLKYLCGL